LAAVLSVRLLGRYLNRETETRKIHSLIERAKSEHIERTYSPRAKAPARLTAEQNRRIVELYLEGRQPVDIAVEVGTSEWTVHHRLNRSGIKKNRYSRDS